MIMRGSGSFERIPAYSDNEDTAIDSPSKSENGQHLRNRDPARVVQTKVRKISSEDRVTALVCDASNSVRDIIEERAGEERAVGR